MKPLDGKVAVVTGASRGLGRAIALALVEAGAGGAVAARSKPDLEETARQVEARGARTLAAEWMCHGIQVNVIAPGWFVTDMNDAAFSDPTIRARLLRDVPASRTLPVDFTQEGGELTPTLKVKRKVVAEKYRVALEELYR